MRGVASALALFAFVGFNPQALAATDTWTGSDTGGTPTTDWANGDNWSYSAGSGPVASGDSLVFTGANGQSTATLTDSLMGLTLDGITYNLGAVAYTFTGNGFTLAGNIINSSTALETINNAITLGGNESVTLTAAGGNVTIGGIVSDGGSGPARLGLACRRPCDARLLAALPPPQDVNPPPGAAAAWLATYLVFDFAAFLRTGRVAVFVMSAGVVTMAFLTSSSATWRRMNWLTVPDSAVLL